ncbi:hypothetical protein FQA39_LY18320 [Lamprigera yunnana]|nr:hypothetical protein FQA39_LY18320 [Lamprigera yunnana]
MSFAVLRFLKEEGSYSEIPTIWILENKQQCYWPNQKNCGSLIERSVTPSEDWSIQDIEREHTLIIILILESLQKARRVAQNPSYTSNERRKQKRNKWANYSGSDDENSLNVNITDNLTDESPKSFKNKSCNEKVQILNVTTLDIQISILFKAGYVFSRIELED